MDHGLRVLLEDIVKTRMSSNDSSHDWLHVDRVRKIALKLVEMIRSGKFSVFSSYVDKFISKPVDLKNYPNPDLLVIEAAALLHDLADPKYFIGSEEEGTALISSILLHRVRADQLDLIISIIEHISYRKESSCPEFFNKLFQEDPGAAIAFAVVQDADRLDAIGAIGIARCFAYGTTHSTPFYLEGDRWIDENDNPIFYQKKGSIYHFYEKLFKIEGLMKSGPGESMAKRRTALMKVFAEQFLAEAFLE